MLVVDMNVLSCYKEQHPCKCVYTKSIRIYLKACMCKYELIGIVKLQKAY